MEGHAYGVLAVHFSPDGKFIASGSYDTTVKVWDAHTGACVRTMEGHSREVRAVHFSPDGKFIASGSGDNTVRVWDAHEALGHFANMRLSTLLLDRMWQLKLADADGSRGVDVQKAVAFLVKSGLRSRLLNEIWGLATSQGEFSSLNVERFKTVSRLLAMVQKGMKLDLVEAAGGSIELTTGIKAEAAPLVSQSAGPFVRPPHDELEIVLAETSLDDLTCELGARLLEKVLEVDAAAVKTVRELKVNGEALYDTREFQELVQPSFPDMKKIEKWVAGGNWANILGMRAIVRRFPELGTWPVGLYAQDWDSMQISQDKDP
ncbi:Vegetative incompatibility protein HET-E-1 [Porphyridium purpureum]|uniref:Vegetative incompatibility protein HET-E-1 n=1 Tax=Porphyridium purpureum TaxID=35688 RepID=A0A5J4YI56_PORPP|nr:Vegetative incompatibility protein HET-E-1 [Porphyridium purpureum]|eukprot:POR7741..scf243_20